MEQSNAIAISILLAFAGFIVGRFDARPTQSQSTAEVASSVGVRPVSESKPVSRPETTVEVKKPTRPAPPVEAQSQPSSLDSQSDEGAGKNANLGKIGKSPQRGSPFSCALSTASRCP
jgi:hypothetical protein